MSAESGAISLLTGATGFVGSAVARRLVEQGHRVRALVRTTSGLRNLEGLPVETHTGDLRDPESLREGMRGCRFVFHVAADYRLWRPDPKTCYEVNVTGTDHVMEAAVRADVERLVYTSSVATLGLRADGTPADESTPAGLGDMVGHYKRSKYLAEEAARRFTEDHDLDIVIVNPSAPVGPRDIRPTPTGRTVLDAAAGRMPAYVDTGLNIVHVDDVATGHLLALERGRRGERYVLGGENLGLREILSLIAAMTGGRAPRLRLSPALLMPLARVAQAWARLRGGAEPRLTVDGLRMARKRMFFSSEKARRELGYRYRPATEALRDAIAWFRENGYLTDREAPRPEARSEPGR